MYFIHDKRYHHLHQTFTYVSIQLISYIHYWSDDNRSINENKWSILSISQFCPIGEGCLIVNDILPSFNHKTILSQNCETNMIYWKPRIWKKSSHQLCHAFSWLTRQICQSASDNSSSIFSRVMNCQIQSLCLKMYSACCICKNHSIRCMDVFCSELHHLVPCLQTLETMPHIKNNNNSIHSPRNPNSWTRTHTLHTLGVELPCPCAPAPKIFRQKNEWSEVAYRQLSEDTHCNIN